MLKDDENRFSGWSTAKGSLLKLVSRRLPPQC